MTKTNNKENKMIDNKKIISHLIYIFDLTTNDLGVIIRSDGRVVCHESQFEDFLNNRGIILESYSSEVAYHIEWSAASVMLKGIKPTAQVATTPDLDNTVSTHGPNDEFKTILVRGGRSGRKIHLASDGGSGSYCGHWFKAHTSHFKVADDTEENRAKYHRNLCTKCFGENSIARAVANSK
jgi:hypothetical protein